MKRHRPLHGKKQEGSRVARVIRLNDEHREALRKMIRDQSSKDDQKDDQAARKSHRQVVEDATRDVGC